jgi:predicted MFS family arabinose efflux permease
MGNYGGHFVAFVIGGSINAHYGWRTTFLVMGLPGVLIAVLIYLTVREPARAAVSATAKVASATFGETLRYLAARRSYIALNLGGALSALIGYGFGIWVVTFFQRVHGMEPAEAGRWLGVLAPIGGLCGTALGGILADRLGPRTPSAYLWIPVFSQLLHVPLSLVLLLGSQSAALAIYLPHTLMFSMYVGPSYAVMQGVVTPRMRSLAVAIHMLIVNLLGLAAGPLIVGALNDALQARYGDEGIRYSLLAIASTGLLAAALFATGARSVARDFEAARAATAH